MYCISKILTDLSLTKQKTKTKNAFVRVVYSALVLKMYWQNIKKVCLSINGAQSVRLEKGIIEFKNYFKKIPAPFKICADFESNLESIESYEGCDSKKYQDHNPCSFAYKLVCVDDRFSKPNVICRGENAAYKFIKAIFKEHQYCKKVIKEHFNKNLVMSEKEEGQFQSSNTGWICEKLTDNDNEKVRDHCHVTDKFRGAAHWVVTSSID